MSRKAEPALLGFNIALRVKEEWFLTNIWPGSRGCLHGSIKYRGIRLHLVWEMFIIMWECGSILLHYSCLFSVNKYLKMWTAITTSQPNRLQYQEKTCLWITSWYSYWGLFVSVNVVLSVVTHGTMSYLESGWYQILGQVIISQKPGRKGNSSRFYTYLSIY